MGSKAETPKGFRDYFGADVDQRKAMLDKIAAVYHAHGFDALESSAVETVEALGSFLPDVDRPNAGVFAWQEDAGSETPGDWMALRYDLTAPLARVFAQHRNDLPTPYRRYAMGPVWRNEKPGPGRYRQFYQCDADTVGTASVAADAEICMMLADALEAVGIERGDYVIRVNNRKVLNGVLEVAGIAEDDERTRGIVLRAIDKLDRLGPEGVRALLGDGRKDESGDFTEGAGLSDEASEAIMRFVTAKEKIKERLIKFQGKLIGDLSADEADWKSLLQIGQTAIEGFSYDPKMSASNALRNAAALKVLEEVVGDSVIGAEGVQELAKIAQQLDFNDYRANRVEIYPSVVRGLGYYTGPVFEAELTFEIEDEKGRPRQFGSVAGGGRYDDLVKRFTGQAVPAVGVSIGVDRLLAALDAKGRLEKEATGPVVVTVMDRDRMGDYQAMARDLRDAGIRAEVYLGNPKNFGNQLKYADKRKSPVAIVQGSDEAERGVVQIKDLILGAKIAETASVDEWKEQKQQFEVSRDDLVAEVRKLLDT
ncbi:MAG: histidine--tRNA ligase [Pseudomonadota bacterium]